MTAVVLRGDAARVPLPDASVDLIITSPPYYGLRSYTDGGEHYAGQIGSEATPAEYVAALVACTAEWVRVLKPSGSLFVNLGDTYAAGHGGSTTEGKGAKVRVRRAYAPNPRERPDLPNPPASWSTREARVRNTIPGVPVKSLMGMPWRYALAATDQLGLILRAEIIWAKPNGLPESVTDRVRRAHEQVFHFTRQPRYYTAVDEIREEPLETRVRIPGERQQRGLPLFYMPSRGAVPPHPLGKLPGSVWTIPSQPLTVPPELGVDHFAAFPMELPRRIIQGWSPPGICCGCGEGRRPVSSADPSLTNSWALRQRNGRSWHGDGTDPKRALGIPAADRNRMVIGYACACPYPGAPTRPAVVLDPFGGTGTTALLADVLGRMGISIDRSHDYTRLARWRTTDPAQRAAALQVPRPPVETDGQLAMFA